jgi:hypothetical protein
LSFRVHLIFTDLDRLAIDDQNFVYADNLRALSVGSPESAVVKVSVKHPAELTLMLSYVFTLANLDIPRRRVRYISGMNSRSLCSQVPDENLEYDDLFASIATIASIL